MKMLSTSDSSPLNFAGSFQPLLICLPNAQKDSISHKPCPTTTYGFDEFESTVSVRHNLEVDNSSSQYQLDIAYTNETGKNKATVNTLEHNTDVTWTWPVNTFDFNLLSYFFIVLIGVIVSRLFKNYTESTQKQTGLQTGDYLWIAFSAVIALIIFANFQQQVHLTRHIITNISLAFGFGFGFDKVLEAGQRLAKQNGVKSDD